MNAFANLRTSFEKRSVGEFIDQARCKYFTQWRKQNNPIIARFGENEAIIHHRRTRDDLFAIWQCFERKQYEIPRQTAMVPDHRRVVDDEYQRIIDRGRKPLIVDCGANIGAGSLWLSLRYPSAVVVAIEPVPVNLLILRKNAQNRSIHVVAGAISHEDGKVRFMDTGSSLSNHMASDQDVTGGYEVDALSLETLCRQAPPDTEPFLLKMDIEGAESVVFGRTHEMFDRFPLIIIEPHDFMMPGRAVASNFFAFHAAAKRDFLFWEENVFSIDSRLFD